MKEVRQDALSVISTGTVEGNLFRITAGQLDRDLYVAVNEALENIGGKWNRKLRGHAFEDDPTDKIEELLLTGKTVSEKQLYQFFETPAELARRVVELADIPAKAFVLEPEAGRGAIADAVRKDAILFCVELDPKHIPLLVGKGYRAEQADFLQWDGGPFDRIVMNPPFTRQQDIDHVFHAYSMLSDGGRLVAIMSPGFTFRQNKKSVAFRELVEQNGYWEQLPEESFKESGTSVNTVIVVLNK